MLSKKEINIIIENSSEYFRPDFNNGTSITKFQSFLAIKRLLKCKLYWETLAKCYKETRDLRGYEEDLKWAFESIEPGRDSLMDQSEMEFMNSLPSTISIYRPMTQSELESDNYGVSWYFDYQDAEEVADEYNYSADQNEEMVVKEIRLKKKKVIASLERDDLTQYIYIHKNEKERIAIQQSTFNIQR